MSARATGHPQPLSEFRTVLGEGRPHCWQGWSVRRGVSLERPALTSCWRLVWSRRDPSSYLDIVHCRAGGRWDLTSAKEDKCSLASWLSRWVTAVRWWWCCLALPVAPHSPTLRLFLPRPAGPLLISHRIKKTSRFSHVTHPWAILFKKIK